MDFRLCVQMWTGKAAQRSEGQVAIPSTERVFSLAEQKVGRIHVINSATR